MESQVTVLRRLVAVGARTPAQLADDLHLARTTISNLIRGLVADGMVERVASETDGRSVTIVPTERGRSVLERFRRGRVDALIEALGGMPTEDRERLLEALPAFDLLCSRLEDLEGTR